jgi:CRP-like cAMP-binding protein
MQFGRQRPRESHRETTSWTRCPYFASKDAFGEIALLRSVPRTATVETREPVLAFRLDAASFIAAVTGNAEGLRAAETIAEGHLSADASRPA